MMKRQKKSQFLLLSAFILLNALLFIYSLETENTYRESFDKNIQVETLMHELCELGMRSNGSTIDANYAQYSSDLSTYCTGQGYECSLTITKDGTAPTDLSLLNYTHYEYTFNFSSIDYVYGITNITC